MVSGAPRSRIFEIDNTQTWQEQSGLGVYLGLPAPAGPTVPTYIPDVETLLDYTLTNSFTATDNVAFAMAKRIINTTGLGLIVNRVCADDVLYGGCTIPCGSSRTASSLPIGLANPQDINFVTATAGVAEKTQFQFRNDVNGNTGGTAFVLPGDKYVISFEINATQETNSFTIVNQDVNGSLANRFFVLPDGAGYVWFEVTGDDVPAVADPGTSVSSLFGLTGYKATFAKNALPSAIATAINTALSEVTGLASTIVENTTVQIVVQNAGVAQSGNSGNSGFKFSRTVIGNPKIHAVTSSQYTVKTVTITRNQTATNIALAVSTLIGTDEDLSRLFDVSIETDTPNAVIITNKTAGPQVNASLLVEAPAPIVIKTLVQGSSTSGSDVLFLYYNNPSSKAQNYGIKLFNCEDYPDKAPQEGTFVIEVYTKSNPRTPESTVTCTRNQTMVDSYNNTMYVVDVLQKLTKIRAIDNVDVPQNELPQSLPDIVWFGGGDSGSEPTLSDYIQAAQPMVDREQYSISLLLPGGFYATPYLQELNRIAAKRGEAVLITGLPTDYEQSVNYQTLIPQWMNDDALLTDSYAAVFSPAAIAYDADMGRNFILPIETCIAEQIAFANENYSISEPILGFARGTLQNILGLVRRYKFSDDGTADGDKLYDVNINPIRFFNNRGYIVWGQKTTQRTASLRDRLNVRLMLTALKPLINDVQLNLIGELPTQATKKRAQGLLNSIFDVGVGRNWFKPDYKVELVEDRVLETQHIQRINYKISPWYSIEFVTGYIILENGIVSNIS